MTTIYSDSHINHCSVKGVALLFAVLRWLAILLEMLRLGVAYFPFAKNQEKSKEAIRTYNALYQRIM